jgi:hypothetical protein
MAASLLRALSGGFREAERDGAICVAKGVIRPGCAGLFILP